MSESQPIMLAYRVHYWQLVLLLPLFALGAGGGIWLGRYVLAGGKIQVEPGIVLRGMGGAILCWGFAVVSVAVGLLLIYSWMAIRRAKPTVVLEETAISVPSKWGMKPVRIPMEAITGLQRSPRHFGKVGYIWIVHDGKKSVIVEDYFTRADAERIMEWIHARRPELREGSSLPWLNSDSPQKQR